MFLIGSWSVRLYNLVRLSLSVRFCSWPYFFVFTHKQHYINLSLKEFQRQRSRQVKKLIGGGQGPILFQYDFVGSMYYFIIKSTLFIKEGSEKLFMDLTHKYKTNTAIYPVQGDLYIRVSANIYNEMSDYQKLADLLCQLPRKH